MIILIIIMELLKQYHFYINLEKRIDRKISCENQLKSIGINKPNRFNAYKEEIGLVGCVKSHIKCLEIAKEKNWSFVCIFEDDVIFINSEKVIENINKYIYYDYDILYIGAWLRNNKYSKINEDLIKVNKANCTHAYIVKNHYYDTLLNNFHKGLNLKIQYSDNGNYNIDEYIKILQEKDKWYCFNPILATQLNGYSNNFNEIRNLKDTFTTIPNIFKKTNNSNYIMNNKNNEIENITITENNESKKIEISEELLQNIRNIIEVANDRIKWKIDELLPVGLVIQQIDNLLKE